MLFNVCGMAHVPSTHLGSKKMCVIMHTNVAAVHQGICARMWVVWCACMFFHMCLSDACGLEEENQNFYGVVLSAAALM